MKHLEPATREEVMLIEQYLRSTGDPEKWNYLRIIIRLNLCETAMHRSLELLHKSVAPDSFTQEQKQAWTDQLTYLTKLVTFIK